MFLYISSHGAQLRPFPNLSVMYLRRSVMYLRRTLIGIVVAVGCRRLLDHRHCLVAFFIRDGFIFFLLLFFTLSVIIVDGFIFSLVGFDYLGCVFLRLRLRLPWLRLRLLMRLPHLVYLPLRTLFGLFREAFSSFVPFPLLVPPSMFFFFPVAPRSPFMFSPS